MPKIISNKSNVDLDYPIVRPSLDLDFTQEELDPRITFSRGSIGTRVNRNRLIETVAANQPRFDYDPVTGECKGLLIEESRSNLVTYSEDFSNASSWFGFDRTISTNLITAPDGNTTADAFIENTLSNKFHYLNQTLTKAASSIQYTGSIWIKDKGRQVLMNLQSGGSNGVVCRFQPATGQMVVSPVAFGTGWTAGSFSVIPYPNGWYRVSMTATSDTLTTVVFQLATYNTSIGSNTYTGDGTSGIYIWGAQLEAGAFPTSYIPTTTATVTRSADLASMTETNFSSWFNQNEGTFYESTYKQTAPSGPGLRVMEISDGTNNNRTEIGYWFSGGLAGPYIYSAYSGPAQYQTYPSTTFPTSTKQAFSYSTFTSNLTYVTSLSSSVSRYNKFLKPTYTSLGIGRGITSINPFGGTISRLTYYPRRLKDNQLQYLTQ